MRYYDIHTHQCAEYPEDVTIVSRIVGRDNNQEICLCEGKRSYGIHPWYIKDVRKQMDELRSLIQADSKVVAIGEVGLDKMAKTLLAEQEVVFREQAYLSEEMAVPLIIHCVRAWAELIACRKVIEPGQPWIIHGFRGNGELAKQLIRQGFRLSFGVHFHPSAVRAAWPNSLFAETDDESIGIRSVYHSLSLALSLSEMELAAQIEENCSIFSID